MSDEYSASLYTSKSAIKFTNKKLWFEYCETDCDSLFSNIEDAVRRLTTRPYDPDDAEILKCITSEYLRNIWISENPSNLPASSTIEVVMSLFDYNQKPADCSETEWKHVTNLKRAMEYLDLRSDSNSIIELNMELICETHRLVAAELFPGGGSFRDVMVGPANYSVTYARPRQIERKLRLLITFIKKYLNESTTLKHILEISTVFFSEFLKIHPFKDGNGRTVRLLLNYILKKHSIVPFSVYGNNMSSDKQRELYLTVLYEAQWNCNPTPLAKYILSTAHFSAQQACFLLL